MLRTRATPESYLRRRPLRQNTHPLLSTPEKRPKTENLAYKLGETSAQLTGRWAGRQHSKGLRDARWPQHLCAKHRRAGKRRGDRRYRPAWKLPSISSGSHREMPKEMVFSTLATCNASNHHPMPTSRHPSRHMSAPDRGSLLPLHLDTH